MQITVTIATRLKVNDREYCITNIPGVLEMPPLLENMFS